MSFAISQDHIGGLPEWTESTLPSDAKLLMFTNEADDDGCQKKFTYFVDFSRITGGTTVQSNQCSLYSPANNITVADGTVVPVYQDSNPPYTVNQASASSLATLAQDLAIKVDPNQTDYLIVQHDGYYQFNDPHNYTVGQTYYLSDTNGQVTTAAGTNSQELFYVIDTRKIRILL